MHSELSKRLERLLCLKKFSHCQGDKSNIYSPFSAYITTDESPKTTSSPWPVQVLVFTYMRSGSSLVGDILQHNDDAFYVYEPLRSLGARNYTTVTITFANGTKR